MSTYENTVPGNPHIKYDRSKLLGSGTFCNVYEAQYNYVGPDKKRDTIIGALKILKPEQLIPEKASSVNQFEQECKLLVSLDHPNLVKAYVYSFDDPIEKWVLMEKCDHNLLEFLSKLKKQSISEATAKELALPIVCGLKELHSRKIVHRDLKLENILVSSSKLIKIADFGLAKQSTQGSKIMLQSFLGTADYMAPEIYQIGATRQGTYNESVDIYAFGNIMFTLCSGAFRTNAEVNGTQYNGKHALEFDPNTFQFPSNFSPQLQDLLRRCWQRDPSKRPSATDILAHPWMGLAKTDIKPEVVARKSIMDMCNLIQKEADPSEVYFPIIAQYIQYAIATKLSELSQKLHNRYKHIVNQYEKSTYWEILVDSHPEFEEVLYTYQALLATYLKNLSNLKSRQICRQLNLTKFEVWQNDEEFQQRKSSFKEDISRYSNPEQEEVTESELAKRFTDAVDKLKVIVSSSARKNSNALFLFINSFAIEVTNLVMKVFKITFEIDIDPAKMVMINGVTLTASHKELLCKLIESRFNNPSAPPTIEYREACMSKEHEADFHGCGQFIRLNMVLELPSSPIFENLEVSTTE